AARLVIQKQPRALARRQRLAVDHDLVIGGDIERGRVDDAAVNSHAPLHHPLLGITARGEPCPRQDLCNALTGLLGLELLARRTFLKSALAVAEIVLALTIATTAAEGRALGEALAAFVVLAAWPIETRPAERGAIVIAAVVAIARKARTIAKSLGVPPRITRLVVTLAPGLHVPRLNVPRLGIDRPIATVETFARCVLTEAAALTTILTERPPLATRGPVVAEWAALTALGAITAKIRPLAAVAAEVLAFAAALAGILALTIGGTKTLALTAIFAEALALGAALAEIAPFTAVFAGAERPLATVVTTAEGTRIAVAAMRPAPILALVAK